MKAHTIIGLDIGSVAIKGVTLDQQGTILRGERVIVSGNSADRLVELITSLIADCHEARFGVTGGAAGLLAKLAGVHAENDLVAITNAVASMYPESRGLIEIGGHQAKWVKLGPNGELESFFLNDQCAAGSGAFLEQQAGRLGLTVDQLASLATKAERAATVAGRCAVFAKSDMIHLQQRGTPPAEIARGLCLALARNFRATLLRGADLATPALFLGGGALNQGLHQALLEVFECDAEQLHVPEGAQYYGAIGVALNAVEAEPICCADVIAHLKSTRSSATGPTEESKGAKALAPLSVPEVSLLDEPELRADDVVAAYLGVDVGSVSTNFCLLSPSGEVIDGIYLRTRGDPIRVLGEGLSILRKRLGEQLQVLGMGTTGSGRHLAGKLLGADVIKNEITCQFLGAKHILPNVDTILEIGGQDSKYVSVQQGRIADFVMNKICAAGTGSFLEEQGNALGVAIKGQFAKLAVRSTRPADLGSQCTVFMDAEVVGAAQRGRSLDDILAGLAYSVAKNYLDRVVAGRPIGSNAVFQGGVASNGAVVSAFESLLGQSITVHPHNRISGAIGAAVAAMDETQGASRFRGLNAIDQVEVRTFECGACTNMCQVSKIKIGGQADHQDKAFFGDVCEKYTSTLVRQDDKPPLPDLTAEVEQLLESYAGGNAIRGIAGIPRASMMYDLFPFWATFLRQLGFKVVLPGQSTMRVLEQGIRRLTAETCLPLKLVYGHVAELIEQGKADFVFLPSVVDIPDNSATKSYLCPFEEAAGFMVGSFAASKLVVPTVSLASSRKRLVRELGSKLSAYSLSPDDVSSALDVAEAAQQKYKDTLRARGRQVLADNDGMAFALLGKPYNVIDAFENLNLSRHLRKLGVLPLPMQMLPVDDSVDLEAQGFTIPWKYNRDIVNALQAVSDYENLYPVLISNFGCGPDAFAMKFLERAAGDRPFLFLEFDEHRGEAGMVTRLEAFVDELEQSRGDHAAAASTMTTRTVSQQGRRVVLPYFADHAWAFLGALRSTGAEVLLLPPPDDETVAYGEEISSGKECHPYVIIAGDLMKHLDRGTIRKDDIFYFPGTTSACLLHQYGKAMELVLERHGVKGVDVISGGTNEQLDLLGMDAMVLLGRGLLTCDYLMKLKRQIRPYVTDTGRVDQLFNEVLPLMADKLAQDRLGEALKPLVHELNELQRNDHQPKPVVGVAGDPYTRVHSFGNANMFDRLEQLGLEVWPSPFLVDVVEFGWRRELSDGLDDGNYREAAEAALLYLRKELEEMRVHFLLRRKVTRAHEPGYRDVLSLAAPYVDPSGNENLLTNVAKMAHFARNGAAGIINAISINCMLGTVAASMTEKIRENHQMIPITTIMYSGRPSSRIDAQLEAFAHQVKGFQARTHP